MRSLPLTALAFLCPTWTLAQQPAPSRVIIDMHLHACDTWTPDARDSMWIPLDLEMVAMLHTYPQVYVDVAA